LVLLQKYITMHSPTSVKEGKSVNLSKDRWSNPYTCLDRPRGFQRVEAPTFQDNRHMKLVQLSVLRTGRFYFPGNTTATHFCWTLSRPQGYGVAGRIISMKDSNKTIRNQTRDLVACSAVSRPTAPPGASFKQTFH